MSTPPRSVALPLDNASAAARARQVAALVEPDRLRVLSALCSADDAVGTAATLAAVLNFDVQQVEQHLAILTDVGLVAETDEDADLFIPTADTWVRFGRLVASPDRPAQPLPAEPQPPHGLGDGFPPVIQRIADRLSYRFSSSFSAETVEQYVADSYRLLSERARVPHHLPSLTARFASDRLGALAVARGLHRHGTPEVLFVCVHNAGRSQMAAALLRQLAGDQVHVRTAGSRPSASIDDTVIAALDEIGVPLVSEFPKPLTDEVVQAADFVITMGCGDACPLYPGRRYMDWPIADPVGRPIEEVRGIRDAIQSRVEDLARELNISPRPF